MVVHDQISLSVGVIPATRKTGGWVHTRLMLYNSKRIDLTSHPDPEIIIYSLVQLQYLNIKSLTDKLLFKLCTSVLGNQTYSKHSTQRSGSQLVFAGI